MLHIKYKIMMNVKALHESRIRTEYGEIRNTSPYLVQMQENTD